MVAAVTDYDFTALVDDFLAHKPLSGPLAGLVQQAVRRRALEILAQPDVRYMPAFKILDLLAALASIRTAVAEAAQLRAHEAEALLRESLSDSAPLVRQFLLDAALERARYEPMMLNLFTVDREAERALILARRWAAMRAAHQERAKLPEDWIETVDNAVEQALASPDFVQFRPGPLLQLFAEMLERARQLRAAGEPLSALHTALSERSPLWRRYALKSARYAMKAARPDLAQLAPVTHRIQ